MPLQLGKDKVGANLRELKKGKTFARTKRKSGPKRAKKQALAIALSTMASGG